MKRHDPKIAGWKVGLGLLIFFMVMGLVGKIDYDSQVSLVDAAPPAVVVAGR